jgi:hypothetical protein
MILTKQMIRDIIAFNSPISENDLIQLLAQRGGDKVNLILLTQYLRELKELNLIFEHDEGYSYIGASIL